MRKGWRITGLIPSQTLIQSNRWQITNLFRIIHWKKVPIRSYREIKIKGTPARDSLFRKFKHSRTCIRILGSEFGGFFSIKKDGQKFRATYLKKLKYLNFFSIMAGVSLFFVCIWFLNWCIAQLEVLLSRKRWRPLLGYRRMSKNCSRVQFV